MDEILKIFEPLFKKWIDDVDMSPFMVYMIDAVDASALPYLAEQFNVQGYRGWDLAVTEADKRELLKNAIAIQKKVGTPYSIKQALKAIGFPNVVINEHIGVRNYYDGTFNYSGLIFYDGGAGAIWVNFSVEISVADAISDATKELVRLLINEYKPARCVLVDLTFNTL